MAEVAVHVFDLLWRGAKGIVVRLKAVMCNSDRLSKKREVIRSKHDQYIRINYDGTSLSHFLLFAGRASFASNVELEEQGISINTHKIHSSLRIPILTPCKQLDSPV